MCILVTSATGYVGGSLVERLRDDGHAVIGLARSEERAEFLRGRGIGALVGSLADQNLLASATSEVDVVVNAAEADDANLVRNLVAPLEGTGKLLVHTSGSSIVVDDAGGAFASDTVFADDAPFTAMPHRVARIETDRMVRSAGVKGGLRSAVICPSTIYGEGRGWKRDSYQIPLLVRKSIERGAGVDLLPGNHAIGRLARHMETSDAARSFYRGPDHRRAA